MTLSFSTHILIAALIGAQVFLVRAFDNSRYDNVSPEHHRVIRGLLDDHTLIARVF